MTIDQERERISRDLAKLGWKEIPDYIISQTRSLRDRIKLLEEVVVENLEAKLKKADELIKLATVFVVDGLGPDWEETAQKLAGQWLKDADEYQKARQALGENKE